MLKTLIQSAVIAAFAFAISVACLSAWRSLHYEKENASEESRSGKPAQNSHDATPRVWAEEAPEIAIARYNRWLMIFTGALAFVALLQIGFMFSADTTASIAANAAQDAADTAQQALVTVQRAFVYLDAIDPQAVNGALVVTPRWRNSGATPTRWLSGATTGHGFAGEIPKDFRYPMYDKSGGIIPDAELEKSIGFIGPQAIRAMTPFIIPPDALASVRGGHQRIYIWGWVRYQDAFKREHITRFCNELKILTIPAIPGEPNSRESTAYDFPQYGPYNCTDEECATIGFP